MASRYKVLHIASFTGNIGDNANHDGFRKKLALNTGLDFAFSEFEIRKTFWKELSFDDEFVALANKYDLIVFGGGNFFELWVDSSSSGTSINITTERIKAIKPPIVFNALGVDIAQGCSNLALGKFKYFLDVVSENPKNILSCRFDGSFNTLKKILGQEYSSLFFHVPDSGIYTNTGDSDYVEIRKDKKNIIIQLAGDMLDKRFDKVQGAISYDEFLQSLSSALVTIDNELEANFIFVPHIFKDLEIISAVLNCLPDKLRRTNVTVAPCLLGDVGKEHLFGIYKKADLILAMRFHANVCSFGFDKPFVGLINYAQVEYFFNEVELQHLIVDVRVSGFQVSLLDRIRFGISQNGHMLHEKNNWDLKTKVYHEEIKRQLLLFVERQ